MIRGRVIGEVWATRRTKGLDGRKLLLVAAEHADQLVVAMDQLDAGAGDRVLVTWGSGARLAIGPHGSGRRLLCDAAIAQVVDGASDREEER